MKNIFATAQRPVRGLRHAAFSLIFIATACALNGCAPESPPAPKALEAGKGGGAGKKKQEKIPVEVVKVARKSVPLRLEAIGNVEPYTTVSVKSRVEGQLNRVAFREGDAVALGQLLFEIDPRPYQAQLRLAKASLTRDRAQWENAKATLKRYEDLQGRNFVSADVLLTARTAVEVGAANIEADEAAVQTAQLQLDYATISSPLAGRTGRVMVHQGNQVKADSVLVVINQIEPVRVSFAIPEQQLAALREFARSGDVKVRAKIDGADDPQPVGKLSFIDNSVDATTGTIKLKATFDNKDQRLWAGQFVRVALDLKEQAGAIVVPSKAAQIGPKGSYVFVIKPDMSAEKREIVVERTQNDEAVISAGLEEGELVVLDGQSRLVSGSLVDIKNQAEKSTQ
jgi:multidrug efflux system membrane fusion protein